MMLTLSLKVMLRHVSHTFSYHTNGFHLQTRTKYVTVCKLHTCDVVCKIQQKSNSFLQRTLFLYILVSRYLKVGWAKVGLKSVLNGFLTAVRSEGTRASPKARQSRPRRAPR